MIKGWCAINTFHAGFDDRRRFIAVEKINMRLSSKKEIIDQLVGGFPEFGFVHAQCQ